MPLYWHLLKAVPSLQIVAASHRLERGAGRRVAAVEAGPRLAARRAGATARGVDARRLSGVLIGFNWGLYIWAVNAGHVVETSLGYFINPLLNVVLGVVFLRERLSRVQWMSVALATVGVAVADLQLRPASRGSRWRWRCRSRLYGLIRKLVAVDSVAGLGVESVYLFLPALALLLWGETHGQGGFFDGWGVGDRACCWSSAAR